MHDPLPAGHSEFSSVCGLIYRVCRGDLDGCSQQVLSITALFYHQDVACRGAYKVVRERV